MGLPLDNIFFTIKVNNKIQVVNVGLEKVGGVASKELWLAGKVNASAKEMLEASGWKITENATDRLMQ